MKYSKEYQQFQTYQAQIKDLKLGSKLADKISSNEEWKEQPAQFPVKREALTKKILELLKR